MLLPFTAVGLAGGRGRSHVCDGGRKVGESTVRIPNSWRERQGRRWMRAAFAHLTELSVRLLQLFLLFFYPTFQARDISINSRRRISGKLERRDLTRGSHTVEYSARMGHRNSLQAVPVSRKANKLAVCHHIEFSSIGNIHMPEGSFGVAFALVPTCLTRSLRVIGEPWRKNRKEMN